MEIIAFEEGERSLNANYQDITGKVKLPIERLAIREEKYFKTLNKIPKFRNCRRKRAKAIKNTVWILRMKNENPQRQTESFYFLGKTRYF